tara:strand:- start:4001 stop:5059 length:1059 start_codon:yes stop_codon:yes gene_type:complete
MKKIIILALAGIGDGLLLTPTISLLRKTYPEAEITALVREKPTKTLFERNKNLDKTLYFPFLQAGYLKSLLYILSLRKEKYDLSILAYPANRFQTNLVSFLIGAKKRLAHKYAVNKLTSLSFLNTQRLQINPQRHTIDENLKLLHFLGIRTDKATKKTVLPILQKEKKEAEQFLKKYELKKKDFLIGVHAASSELGGMANKRWPKEKFSQLLKKLIQKKKAKILLFGSPTELGLNKEIQKLINNKNVYLTTELQLFPSLALVEHCNLIITNDSLLMNVAGHYNTTTLVLSAHLYPTKYCPPIKKIKYLTPKNHCNYYQVGKDLDCKYKGTPNYCLNKITIEEAYASVEELLK